MATRTMTLKLEGLDQIIRDLKYISEQRVPQEIRTALREGAHVIRDEVELRAPVDTGLLESKITVRALKPRGGMVGYRVTVAPDEGFVKETKSGLRYYYPAILEYGAPKKNIQAREFMRDSFEVRAEEALDVIGKSLKAGLEAKKASTGRSTP